MPEIQHFAHEMEGHVAQAGQKLEAEMKELHDDIVAHGLEDHFTMVKLGEPLIQELNQYKDAERQLDNAIENRLNQAGARAEEWWATHGHEVEQKMATVEAKVTGFVNEVEAARAPHAAAVAAHGQKIKASIEEFEQRVEATAMASKGKLEAAITNVVAEAHQHGAAVD